MASSWDRFKYTLRDLCLIVKIVVLGLAVFAYYLFCWATGRKPKW